MLLLIIGCLVSILLCTSFLTSNFFCGQLLLIFIIDRRKESYLIKEREKQIMECFWPSVGPVVICTSHYTRQALNPWVLKNSSIAAIKDCTSADQLTTLSCLSTWLFLTRPMRTGTNFLVALFLSLQGCLHHHKWLQQILRIFNSNAFCLDQSEFQVILDFIKKEWLKIKGPF